MVRNEAAVIADCIGHLLLHLRIDRVYVADNDSTDATPAILRRIAASDPRLSVRNAPDPYAPDVAEAALLHQAMTDGADWVLPLDADEFPWVGATALRHRLAGRSAHGACTLSVSNFVQWHTVAKDHPGSLRTMLFSARPSGTEQDARALVDAGLPFLRMRYPPKIVVRAAPDLHVHHGHHHAEGLAGPLDPAPIAPLLHAPMRSRDDLITRVAHGRRAVQWWDDPAVNWHLRRMARMDDAALDREWALNSVGWPPAPDFRFDPRLAWLAHRLTGFRKRVT